MPVPFVVSPSAVLETGFSNHLLEQGLKVVSKPGDYRYIGLKKLWR